MGITLEVKQEGLSLASNWISAKSEPNKPDDIFNDRLKRTYFNFYENYYIKDLRFFILPNDVYPKLVVNVNNEESEVVFDKSLYQQLFDMYVIHGWGGILEVKKELKYLVKDDSEGLSGGVILKDWGIAKPQSQPAWKHAKLFFDFTERILAIMIRESLINIERKSSQSIISSLNSSASFVLDALQIKYNFTRIKEQNSDKYNYTVGNSKEAEDLFMFLSEYISKKRRYELSLLRISFYKKAIESLRNKNTNSGGLGDLIEEKQFNLSNELDQKQALEILVPNLANYIKKNHPFALLIVPSLKVDFERSEMENLFGLTIDLLYANIDGIASAIDNTEIKITTIMPWKENTDTLQSILLFHIPENGLEHYVINYSLQKTEDSNDKGYLSLLSEKNITLLVDREKIQKNSFEYVVSFHYRSILIKQLEIVANDQKRTKQTLQLISRVTAGISVATLITPASPVGRVFGFASFLIDSAILAHSVASIVESLKELDNQMKGKLINQDKLDQNQLAELGEILLLKKEIVENITEQLVIEIISLGVAQLKILREVVRVKGFYYDIETLVTSSESE
jgi:hypothetical protein